ncbi:uncharacterized protein LOC103963530 isoform X1 [Pyrus x bretschneideri]|uniref:uncharacterized protein LOC103963530 isoform X1 n=1 Tax=Pyrus x bretschneideri TaxID=225117 RepID=UPI00202DC3ED|nr:uncharacterized protein LOC103963530 isoform X1 [Pyrus x bretschneideri]XP_048430538.1 uncharacterized protein LOC103963530 isoform X1 [Pyrus x bretschneideri]XP_048430539.1 uncharacterized protein LOC103963530 isoform X1 [Pyrus x bretschneideri]XP_048430540.1 uncharacterized protein LOC103963530 isoform X1 [Pyrus x bretschneideri]XP_048430541.1 uncharacterized protein LOC103963530 isoform X1 [Pyrus x bretschneideri]
MDKPRPVDFNCLTTAAREVRLSRALPFPPPTPLYQMLSCTSRRTTAMASIPSSTFASGSTWERTEESTSIINLFAIEFVREKVCERKKSNREGWMKRNTHQSFQQLEVRSLNLTVLQLLFQRVKKSGGHKKRGERGQKNGLFYFQCFGLKKEKRACGVETHQRSLTFDVELKCGSNLAPEIPT